MRQTLGVPQIIQYKLPKADTPLEQIAAMTSVKRTRLQEAVTSALESNMKLEHADVKAEPGKAAISRDKASRQK